MTAMPCSSSTARDRRPRRRVLSLGVRHCGRGAPASALHPFDQPDVEAAKVAARRLTAAVEATGALPAETPFFVQRRRRALRRRSEPRRAPARRGEPRCGRWRSLFAAHLVRVVPGDYVALLAFLDMSADNERAISALARAGAEATGAATSAGFGPRFLHSTGQAHKGRAGERLFLQLTERPVDDLPVPGQRLTFGQVVAAQARGDLQVARRARSPAPADPLRAGRSGRLGALAAAPQRARMIRP